MLRINRFLLAVFCVECASAYLGYKWTPVVEIAQGKLRGISMDTHNKYLGIPYAKVGKRYQAANAPSPWKKTFPAVQDKQCRQLLPVLKLPYGTEDCLILNVYTPKSASPDNPVPVMFYVHGGGFNIGSSNSVIFGPEPLVEKGVVVVTITYRLGAAGFLCLGLEEAPGNVGLKDQVAALRWVNKNIKAFGGDPNSVTIFGESAGATSVHLMILSKMSQGLFHRAILESNTALSSITFTYDPIEKASEIADRLGYTTKDPKQLVKIFNHLSSTDIVKATDSEELAKKFNFSPCVEKELPNIEPFLTKAPHELLSKGNYTKVPMLIGHNEKEGTLFTGMLSEKDYTKYSKHFETWLPPDIHFRTQNEKVETGKVVKEFYFGNKSYIRSSTEDITRLITDAYFHYPNVLASEMHLSTSRQPLYNYYYTYDSVRTIGHGFSRLPHILGPTHFDEVFYLFRPSLRIEPFAGRDLRMANRMAELWTNFAKMSNPTPTTSELIPNLWMPSDTRGLQFYNLDDNMRMIGLPNAKRMNLWRSIYKKFGFRKPSVL